MSTESNNVVSVSLTTSNDRKVRISRNKKDKRRVKPDVSLFPAHKRIGDQPMERIATGSSVCKRVGEHYEITIKVPVETMKDISTQRYGKGNLKQRKSITHYLAIVFSKDDIDDDEAQPHTTHAQLTQQPLQSSVQSNTDSEPHFGETAVTEVPRSFDTHRLSPSADVYSPSPNTVINSESQALPPVSQFFDSYPPSPNIVDNDSESVPPISQFSYSYPPSPYVSLPVLYQYNHIVPAHSYYQPYYHVISQAYYFTPAVFPQQHWSYYPDPASTTPQYYYQYPPAFLSAGSF